MIMVLFFALVVAQAGTQPPNAVPPSGTGTLICHYDANDGQVHLERVQPDQAPVDRGTATQGHDTLALSSTGCAVDNTPIPAQIAPQRATATSTPSAVPSEPSPTPAATATPTALPAAEVAPAQVTATPTPTEVIERVPEPTMPVGPLPPCSPDQPQGTACGGKG